MDLCDVNAINVNAINGVVVKDRGVPDILVNAAGIGHRNYMDQLSAKFWDETIAVNLTAPFALGHKLDQLWLREGAGASSIQYCQPTAIQLNFAMRARINQYMTSSIVGKLKNRQKQAGWKLPLAEVPRMGRHPI